MRDDPFDLIRPHLDTIADRFEGWELVEFLQIPADEVLAAFEEFGWIDEDNVEDFLDFVSLQRGS